MSTMVLADKQFYYYRSLNVVFLFFVMFKFNHKFLQHSVQLLDLFEIIFDFLSIVRLLTNLKKCIKILQSLKILENFN